MIGLIKKSYGDVCGERKEEMAKKMIMMRVILWNIAVLLATGFGGFRFFVVFNFAFEMAWLANYFRNDKRFFEHSHTRRECSKSQEFPSHAMGFSP